MSEGVVLVRPVQRFLQVRKMQGLAQSVKDVTVTKKLDGVMMSGVVVGMGVVTVWSRDGVEVGPHMQ